LIVVEEAVKATFTAPPGFTELERRAYDDTALAILRFAENDGGKTTANPC
jgi:16S rRNA (guanine966-N2)-methyltransferase